MNQYHHVGFNWLRGLTDSTATRGKPHGDIGAIGKMGDDGRQYRRNHAPTSNACANPLSKHDLVELCRYARHHETKDDHEAAHGDDLPSEPRIVNWPYEDADEEDEERLHRSNPCDGRVCLG